MSKRMTKAEKRKHDLRVGLFGCLGAAGLFGFSVFLAGLGPYIDAKTHETDNQEESTMYIDESVIDDVEDTMEERSVVFNGCKYILVEDAVDVLKEYLNEEEG